MRPQKLHPITKGENMKNNLKKHDRIIFIGSCFTLIELLVVIAIITILPVQNF